MLMKFNKTAVLSFLVGVAFAGIITNGCSNEKTVTEAAETAPESHVLVKLDSTKQIRYFVDPGTGIHYLVGYNTRMDTEITAPVPRIKEQLVDGTVIYMKSKVK